MNESNFRKALLELLPWERVCVAASVALAVFVFGSTAVAQDAPPRPSTEDLLPETTVAYVQIDNVQETLPKLMSSEIMDDENIAPFIERMYQEAEAAYEESAQENVGMTLQQIRDLPSGEVTLAVIAPRRKDLEYLVAVEIDPDSEAAEVALGATEGWKEQFSEQGLDETVEATESGVEIYSYTIPDAPRPAHAFVRDGWFVSCTSREELVAVLARWEGLEVEKVRPLSENRKFVTISNRCRGTADIQPEIRLFFDPISLARSAFRGNAVAQGVMNFLPMVGLDGVLGLGGSISLQSEDFKAVFNGHLLLANPRAGVLEMLALKPGESDPEPWVPADVNNYFSSHVDARQAIDEFEKLVDKFDGEGAFKTKAIGGFNEQTGLDFYADVIDALDGRITFLQWSDPETEYLLNTSSNGFALGLSDLDKGEKVMEVAIAKFRERDESESVQTEEYEGVEFCYFGLSDERRAKREERIKKRMGDAPMRFAEPSFCLLDGSLVICDSVGLLKHMIEVSRGKSPALAEDEEYTDQMETLFAAVGTDVPCAVTFNKPAGPMRDLIRLVNDDRSKAYLEKMSERVPVLSRLGTALDEEPMPNVEQLERYLKPAGMIVTTDDTGYHMLTFQYAADEE